MSETADSVKTTAESKESEESVTYNVGDYVELQGAKKKTRKGYIRFKGKIEAFGECVGIELDEKINDGTNGRFNDEQYFECDEGKGSFIKMAKIIKKLEAPKSTESTTNIKDKDNESFPANANLISKSESEQLAPKRKKKKKKKKMGANTPTTNGKKSKKGTSKKGTGSQKNLKPSNARRANSKRNSASAPSKKKSASGKKEIDFNIPTNGTNKDKLKFIFSRINNVKSPFKKRVEIMSKTIILLEDEKCDDLSAKYAVDQYKKCFASQLTDRKKTVHLEALKLLESMVKTHPKQLKLQTAFYLKHLMEYMEKADNKTTNAAESLIKLMCLSLTVKDNKCLGIIMAELIRFGTSAKHKTSRKNGWKFIGSILKRYEPKKGAKDTKKKKVTKSFKTVLDAIQTGLKQGLADSDKATQKEAMSVLIILSMIDETRADRLTARMSAGQRRNLDKLTGRRPKNSQTNIKSPIRKKKKTVKAPKKSASKKGSKPPKSPKVTAKSSKKDTKKGTKDKKSVADGKKGGKKVKKGAGDKKKKKKQDDDDKKEGKTTIAKKKEEVKENKKEIKKEEEEEAAAKVVVVEEEEDRVTIESDKAVKKEEEEIATTTIEEPTKEEESIETIITTTEAVKNEEEEEDESDEEEEDDEYEDDDEDDEDSDSSDEDGDELMNSSDSNENDARDLIESFLDLKDPQINWKMIEFLSKDNMTHLLMSYISRMPQGPKIWQMELSVDLECVIGNTQELSSSASDEIRSTQLSYSLMRILSNEHCAETVKSFLLRKCQEICLHALAVFHPSSSGNVYHGRVVLEILLNHWPKSFMAALTNQRHIQSLLKCALFRNLHQGNLNSFFLDLICFGSNGSAAAAAAAASSTNTAAAAAQIQPVKSKLISMFVEWKFVEYLLRVSTTDKYGDDSVATKYATFFIDLVARCAAIREAEALFVGTQNLIIDSFMNGLLSADLSRWHRISCGQTLVQFLDICSRPTIMDPASAMAGMLGVVAPDPMTNILHPMFDGALQRLHTFIPKMCHIISSDQVQLAPIKLASSRIAQPFGQIKLNCLELLTVSADFAQFKCGDVLNLLAPQFWGQLLNMAFIHDENNMFLCHFRRLIHLSMIFRRRFLKFLFVEEKMLERFVDYYENQPHPRTTLHGYILQMLWDIFNHDQQQQDDDEEDDECDPRLENNDSLIINEEDDENQNQNQNQQDVVLKPNFSKEAEDQWDIVEFFNENQVWKQFIVTVSIEMEAQNATEPQVPNANMQNNQQQLDQLLQNLLGPNNDEQSDSTDSDSDSDED